MSEAEYFELRGLVFSVSVFFSSTELIPLKRFLLENEVPVAQWLFRVHEKVLQTPLISDFFQDFMRETHEELFLTKNDLIQFYTHNYQDLLDGKIGDNLTRKYKCRVLSNYYSQCLSVAIAEALALCKEFNVRNAKEMLKDIQTFLSTRDFKLFSERNSPEVHSLQFDVPVWVYTQEAKLSNLKGDFQYQVLFTNEAHNKINRSTKLHGNLDLALQILYRDSTQRFWPQWQRIFKNQKGSL
ncbi:MAG: hypothetical protein L7F78_02420, partial [Syntrophales bacterium LBB04]|nr:hypothetical protein [Syntrophales bacterium LBB04]